MSELVPVSNIDKILYLDVDIIVAHDLSELYSVLILMTITVHFDGAVEDPVIPRRRSIWELETRCPLLQFGVIMLLNLKAWRTVELNKQLAAFVIQQS